jgi:Domain of unknown function (DUF4450)
MTSDPVGLPTGSFFVGIQGTMRFLFPALLALHSASAQPAPLNGQNSDEDRARPIHYQPAQGALICENGRERYNRPLYGNDGFRVDAGDTPEYLIYRSGRAACIQWGIETPQGKILLHQAASIKATYRNGWMEHEIQDPVLARSTLHLRCLPSSIPNAALWEIESTEAAAPLRVWLIVGGADGKKGNRGGDIGCEKQPVAEFFQLTPASCEGNAISREPHGFSISGKSQRIQACLPEGFETFTSDATNWDSLPKLTEKKTGTSPHPVAVSSFELGKNGIARILIRVNPDGSAPLTSADDLAEQAAHDQQRLTGIAQQVRIDTPDAYLNAAMPALNIAANAVWDEKQGAFMHGAVAWRKPLLGWRGPNAGDALGWHERTARHFDTFAARQNTSPIPLQLPQAEPSANGSRNENALHSNGDLSHSHYDMNLLAVDAILRHLRWTGDIDYARKIWPVLQRHVDWERRLFRREFGEEKWPLQEAYCCIWASDDLAYNGGGTTHSSALFYQQLTSLNQIAAWIGAKPLSDDREASRIRDAMNHLLWQPQLGCFAEWKDSLGRQLTHPSPACWTFYHTMDSGVPDAFQAWQMADQVQNDLPHFPIKISGLQENAYVIATTNWMPYTWSLNNVVLAESAHTSLGLWQAGRKDLAFPLLKGCILDSMFLGLCPGNVGMTSYYDAYRREAQRDFADGIGTLSRAIVEGLYGITPDLITGSITIRPGFPDDWDHATMQHPDFDFSYRNNGLEDHYEFHRESAKAFPLHWQLNARAEQVASVTCNGHEIPWHPIQNAVGVPRIEILTPPSAKTRLQIIWRGNVLPSAREEIPTAQGTITGSTIGQATIQDLYDPQKSLIHPVYEPHAWHATLNAGTSRSTYFLKMQQGDFTWWLPIQNKISKLAPDLPNSPAYSANPPPRESSDEEACGKLFQTSWNSTVDPARIETIPLDSVFNLKVTDLFKQRYDSPRPASCSLSTPFHGYGSWCHPQDQFELNDAGTRASAGISGDLLKLPNGVPLRTPGNSASDNIAVISQWQRFPDHLEIPLHGTAEKAYLLMTGTAPTMQSRCVIGEIIVHYKDGSSTQLDLENPTTWWPIEQDYRMDGPAYLRPGPLPLRLDLSSGKFRSASKHEGRAKEATIPGGAATIMDLPLEPGRELKCLEIHALANEVLIGLMSLSLDRPAPIKNESSPIHQ